MEPRRHETTRGRDWFRLPGVKLQVGHETPPRWSFRFTLETRRRGAEDTPPTWGTPPGVGGASAASRELEAEEWAKVSWRVNGRLKIKLLIL